MDKYKIGLCEAFTLILPGLFVGFILFTQMREKKVFY